MILINVVVGKSIYKQNVSIMRKKHWTSWVGAIGFLFFLFVASRWIPETLVDPWGLFKPRKIFKMLGALAAIQMTGAALIQILGARVGMVVSGFMGGLVSSTALTAALAHKSQRITEKEIAMESLSFLSATLAMLIQAMMLVFIGLNEMHPVLWIVFAAPIGMTVFLIISSSHKLPRHFEVEDSPLLDIASIFKLTIFIAGVLALSKFLQNVFGRNGLEALTFLVSLFEIHGSVIANVQLHETGGIDISLLGELLVLSLMASYISKLILVATLGHPFLKRRVLLWAGLVLSSLGGGWLVFHYFVSII